MSTLGRPCHIRLGGTVNVYRSGCHLSVSRVRWFEVGLSIAANARTKVSVASSGVLLKVKSLPNFCLRYMIALGVAMNSIIWLFILAPLCLSLVFWVSEFVLVQGGRARLAN